MRQLNIQADLINQKMIEHLAEHIHADGKGLLKSGHWQMMLKTNQHF